MFLSSGVYSPNSSSSGTGRTAGRVERPFWGLRSMEVRGSEVHGFICQIKRHSVTWIYAIWSDISIRLHGAVFGPLTNLSQNNCRTLVAVRENRKSFLRFGSGQRPENGCLA